VLSAAEPFSRLRFAQYATDLSGAIIALSRENRMSIESLKQRLAHLPEIENLTMRLEGGMEVYSVGAGFASVPPGASDAEIEQAISSVSPTPVNVTPLPAAPTINESKPAMTAAVPPAGSFAASLKAMVDEAQAGIEQARADGRAVVGAAIGKLNGVKASTTKVASGMAKQIEDAADAALSDLGQISNEL